MLRSRVLTARAKRRAALRKKSGGATMFVVSITLAALAVMTVFGLGATAADVQAAGHTRDNMQSRHVAEHMFRDAANAVNPQTVSVILTKMFGGPPGQATNCKSAKPYTGDRKYCQEEACTIISPAEFEVLLRGQQAALGFQPFFTATSFGPNTPAPYPLDARSHVELTNPIVIEAPGTATGGGTADLVFYQITATVFAELKSNTGPLTPPESMAVGRGRITVGPAQRFPGCRPP
jgi:hypothetical protein